MALMIGDLFDQPGVGAALIWRYPRARMSSETADMHLIDDGLGERPAEKRIAFPVIDARIDDDAP
jgi:hypothetical protein